MPRLCAGGGAVHLPRVHQRPGAPGMLGCKVDLFGVQHIYQMCLACLLLGSLRCILCHGSFVPCAGFKGQSIMMCLLFTSSVYLLLCLTWWSQLHSCRRTESAGLVHVLVPGRVQLRDRHGDARRQPVHRRARLPGPALCGEGARPALCSACCLGVQGFLWGFLAVPLQPRCSSICLEISAVLRPRAMGGRCGRSRARAS